MHPDLSPSEAEPKETELGWTDAPLPELLRLAWPIVLSMLSASVMTLVDTFFVSRLGTWALSGVGLGGIVSFAVVCFPLGSLGAVKILASQAVGAGRPDSVQKFLGAGLLLAGAMAAVATGVALGGSAWIQHAAASPETGDAAQTYLRIGALGILPMLVRVAIEQTRLALGDSRSPMYVALFSNACNVGFNYAFIVVLEMGVAGAAYGTVAAILIGSAAMIGVQVHHGFHVRGTRLHHVGSVWRLGIPTGLQMLLEMGAFTMMVLMLTNLSDLDGAANQIAIQVIHFGFLPCVAMAEGASILVGQAVGAGRRDLVHVVARGALLPIVGFAVVMALAFSLGGSWVAAQFTVDPNLITLTTQLLYIAAAFQLADGVNILARSVLRGTGDVRFCAFMGILVSWGMTPPLTWLFGYHYGLGALGGWIGLFLEIALGAALFWWRLHSNRWHHAADRTTQEVSR